MTPDTKKLVFVTNVVAPDKLGGLERYVRELAAELVRAGHEVTVISKRKEDNQAAFEVGTDGVKIRRYSGPSKSDPLFALKYPFVIWRRVSEAIRAEVGSPKDSWERDDVIVHGHFAVPSLFLALRNYKYIYTCHAPIYKEILGERQGSYRLPKPLQSLAVWLTKISEKIVFRKARKIITLSRFIRNEVKTVDKKSYEKVSLIPGGLQTDYFTPADVARVKFWVDPENAVPTLFTARRIVHRTGVELLVKAVPTILEDFPKLQVNIAGSGPLADSLKNLIKELGISDSVRLLGRIPEEDLLENYRSADIAVTPTLELEGFGLSTAEALACGTPVVVTPAGANPEVVEGIGYNLVSDEVTPESLAARIIELLRNPEALAQVADKAREHTHPRFGWPVVAQKHEEIYETFQQVKK